MANIETGVAEAPKPADNITLEELSSMFAPATVEPIGEQTEAEDTVGEQSPVDAEEEPVEEAPLIVPEPEDEPEEPDEPEEEAQAESEEEPEETEEAEETVDEPESTDSRWEKKFQKRVNKLTARSKEAEERARQAEDRVAELEQDVETYRTAAEQPVAGPDEGPLADINTVQQLRDEKKKWLNVKHWCEEHADGGNYTDDNGKEVYIEPSEVQKAKRDAETHLVVSIPEREEQIKEFNTKETRFNEPVYNMFPEWKDPKSAFYKQAMEIASAVPEVKRLPHWRGIVTAQMIGLQHIQKMMNGKTKKSARKESPAPVSVRSNSAPAPTRGTPADKAASNADNAFYDESSPDYGSADALQQMFSAKRKARRVAA